MSNVIEFKPRKQPQAETPVVAGPANDELRQVAGAQPALVSISHTAAEQMLKALVFYAKNGWDEGVAARKALQGMTTVVQAGRIPDGDG